MYTNDDIPAAHIDPAAANENSSSAARSPSTARLTRPADAVLLGASNCGLLEGGLGI